MSWIQCLPAWVAQLTEEVKDEALREIAGMLDELKRELIPN
jgi:hypothetical protein